MSSIDNLKELDNFELFKSYIKNFIINCDTLFRLIYFPYSNPFSSEYEADNPEDIFKPSSEHGCVLFRQKNDVVLSNETTNVLISFFDTKISDYYFLNDLYICFRILCKGTNIQELENGVSRINAIAKCIDDQFSLAEINNVAKVKRLSYKDISINEQNGGMLLTYSVKNPIMNINENVNYQIKKYGKKL